MAFLERCDLRTARKQVVHLVLAAQEALARERIDNQRLDAAAGELRHLLREVDRDGITAQCRPRERPNV